MPAGPAAQFRYRRLPHRDTAGSIGVCFGLAEVNEVTGLHPSEPAVGP